jgi:hypothetical protein
VAEYTQGFGYLTRADSTFYHVGAVEEEKQLRDGKKRGCGWYGWDVGPDLEYCTQTNSNGRSDIRYMSREPNDFHGRGFDIVTAIEDFFDTDDTTSEFRFFS